MQIQTGGHSGEAAFVPAALRLVRIPLIVTDDSGIVTGHSGDRDRCHG